MPNQQSDNEDGNLQDITAELLRRWPLPQAEGGDKETRGRVLVVGGATSMPGAIILAATAALRAGAGKLQIGTCATVAQGVGVAVPEALVNALPETPEGGIAPAAAEVVGGKCKAMDALLIGSGMVDEDAVIEFVSRLVPQLEETVLVLDAEALMVVKDNPAVLHHLNGRVILTPHAGEMAKMLGIDKTEVTADPSVIARQAAATFGAVVALKGAETFVADPAGIVYHFRGGTVGLATSGSGDTLAGVVVGLAARGATPIEAAAWGVFLHGGAGARLAERNGKLGFLARELLAEIPPLMAEFDDS